MSQPTGIVNIRGRSYETVALRVQKFREKHPDYRLITEIIERNDICVVMRASIYNGDVLIATGHAEEYRKSSDINRTSALENCETSAIGRALATLGLGGTEFASADEVARAVSGQKGEAPVISPVRESLAELTDEQQRTVEETAETIVGLLAKPNIDDRAVYRAFKRLSSDERVALWNLWADSSRIRSRVKQICNVQRQIEAQADPEKVDA